MAADKGLRQGTIGDTLELPRNKYVLLDSFMQRFLNSTSQNGRPNGQNLSFVVGAEGSGKSTLIR